MSPDLKVCEPPVERDVVRTLEELLDQAKAGKIIKLAYACVRPGADVRFGFSTGVWGIALLGGVRLLEHMLTREFFE